MMIAPIQFQILSGMTVNYFLTDTGYIYKPIITRDPMGGIADDLIPPDLDEFGVDLTQWEQIETAIPILAQLLYRGEDKLVADQLQVKTNYTVSVPIGTDIGDRYLIIIVSNQGPIKKLQIFNLEDIQTDQTVLKFAAIEVS